MDENPYKSESSPSSSESFSQPLAVMSFALSAFAILTFAYSASIIPRFEGGRLGSDVMIAKNLLHKSLVATAVLWLLALTAGCLSVMIYRTNFSWCAAMTPFVPIAILVAWACFRFLFIRTV